MKKKFEEKNFQSLFIKYLTAHSRLLMKLHFKVLKFISMCLSMRWHNCSLNDNKFPLKSVSTLGIIKIKLSN